jgi:hypothetical protein
MFFRTPPPAPTAGGRPASVCEPLESRQLLAADLVATEVVGRFPDDLISGERARIPALGVNINNAGNENVRGQVVFRVFASADGILDGADPLLVEQTKRLNLKAGRPRRVPLAVRDVPPTVPQGTYRLLVQVDATNTVVEDNEQNNSIASSDTVAIGPPFVNLTATKAFLRPPVRGGRNAGGFLTVLNAGNVNARGSATVNVLFRPVNQTTGGTAVDVPVRINIRPKATKILKGRIPVPAGLTPGDYTVIATITTVVGFADANPADNSATVAPVTVS